MTVSPNLDFHQEAAEAFAAFFPINPHLHGVHLGVDAAGNKKVTTVRGQPMGAGMLHSHLQGESWLGWLPYHGEETTRHVMVDMDSKDYPTPDGLQLALQLLRDHLQSHGLEAYPARSTRGNGFHVHLFLQDPLPHKVVKIAMKHLLLEAGLPYKTEVFPKGGADSNWFFMPYCGSLCDPYGLGRTFLETWEEQAIPVWELGEYLSFSPSTVLQDLYERCTSQVGMLATTAEQQDLLPEAFEVLRRLAMTQGPDGGRHDTLAAFLNLGLRCGKLQDMRQLLATLEVYQLWTGGDGSRSFEAWQGEVERWSEAVVKSGGTGYGLPYLRAVGYDLCGLPPLVARLTVKERVRRLHGQLSEVETQLVAKALAVSMTSPRHGVPPLTQEQVLLQLQKYGSRFAVSAVVAEVFTKREQRIKMKGLPHLENRLLPELEGRHLKNKKTW